MSPLALALREAVCDSLTRSPLALALREAVCDSHHSWRSRRC